MGPTTVSLKAFSEFLAPILGQTPNALYERQRALARLKLIPTNLGKGPTAGVRATPQTVATLLGAVLLADGLNEIDERVRTLLRSKTQSGTPCRITRAPTFGDGLAALLTNLAQPARQSRKIGALGLVEAEDAPPAMSVSFVAVHRSVLLGEIYRDAAAFTYFGKNNIEIPEFQVTARIDATALTKIGTELASTQKIAE